MNIQAVVMIRNEIDIVSDFLAYNLELFDKILLADMQSSDGTLEVIQAYAEATGKIEVNNLPYLAKYQAESLKCLSTAAFENGADWVFFLDADEFLKVGSREEFQDYLKNFGSEVMHLPWVNLIPSSYGTFSEFDLTQEFFWTGRVSKHSKVAISGQYFLSYPNFVLEPGNHNVKPSFASEREQLKMGLPLYHIPVRSVERIKYKAANALDLQRRKHNQRPKEGFHHKNNLEILSQNQVSPEILNGMCMDYGSQEPIVPVDPKKLDWPKVRLQIPEFERPAVDIRPPNACGLRKKDASRNWRPVEQPRGAIVGAKAVEGELVLLPQSIRGNGSLGPLEFTRLQTDNFDQGVKFNDKSILKALCASLTPPPFAVFSAWTDLVPALGMIFAATRPRRYVELGTHNGMSFFSACQFSEILETNTQCIAVDSWEGDPHAGAHSPEVFTDFESRLRSRFPTQLYLRTYFEQAAQVFDDGSIDLVHIDGFHSYEAVKKDFETWLPKMTDRGVMIFHDTNVHERGFGVWRFWEEVTRGYPSIELKHGHGLGILYVGKENADVAEVFEFLRAKPEYVSYLKTFLEAQVETERVRNKEARSRAAKHDEVARQRDKIAQVLAERTEALNIIATDKWWRRTRHFRRWSNSIRKFRGRPKKRWPGPV